MMRGERERAPAQNLLLICQAEARITTWNP